jgi:hypothetical protein
MEAEIYKTMSAEMSSKVVFLLDPPDKGLAQVKTRLLLIAQVLHPFCFIVLTSRKTFYLKAYLQNTVQKPHGLGTHGLFLQSVLWGCSFN